MWGEPIKQSPSIRAGFEKLKANLAEGQYEPVEKLMFGQSVELGAKILASFVTADRLDLNDLDPLTRFFITRYRGGEDVPDLSGLAPQAGFLLAFHAFPYLDVMLDELVVGDFVREEAGVWLYSQVLADEIEDDLLPVRQEAGLWQFDLMPAYQAKADALLALIEAEFGGDFDAFLMAFVADQDLAFDREKAFTPL